MTAATHSRQQIVRAGELDRLNDIRRSATVGY
jgi:hypothetical protein